MKHRRRVTVGEYLSGLSQGAAILITIWTTSIVVVSVVAIVTFLKEALQ